jgi:hypothetical protein
MNTITLPTRQQMRTFVQRANLLNNSKLFKSSASKNDQDTWDALRINPTKTLQAPSKPAKVRSIAFNASGSAVTVTHKRSLAARMALVA